MSVPSGIVSFVSPRISAISLKISGNKTNYFFRDQTLKAGYSPCCACAILFVLVDYYLSFPWFPIRLRNIRAILYLLIQGVGIHSFEEIFNDL